MKISLLFCLIISFTGLTARADLPASFNKNEIEANVLRKFVSLESERSDFYRITNIEITEIEDNVFHRPGYAVKINYETPTCKNNYFKGLAFSVQCDENLCPFGMIYKKCF